jgi:hypothetical protein
MKKVLVGVESFVAVAGSLTGNFVEAEYLKVEAGKLVVEAGKLAAEVEWLAVEVGLLAAESGLLAEEAESLMAEVEAGIWVLEVEWFVAEVEYFASGASEAEVGITEHYCWLHPMENPKHCFPHTAHQVQLEWGPSTTWSSVVCQPPGAG